MEIETPFVWTIAEANRLADTFATMGLAAPLAYASAVWAPNPCGAYEEFDSIKSHFRVLFECGATYCLEDDCSFGKPAAWFEGEVDFQTAHDEHPNLLAQVVRIVGLEAEFPIAAAGRFLSEAAVAFAQSDFAVNWYIAGRAYGFQEQLGADISLQCHWWQFLVYVSELNQVPIRYIRRCCVTGFEPGGHLEFREAEEPLSWSIPDVSEAIEEKCDADGIDYFAYVCHWPNVLRASELACRWVAAKLTALQELQNLGSGFGSGNAAYGDVGISDGTLEDSEIAETRAEPAVAKVSKMQTDALSETSNLIVETERLFQAILRYCEAKREFWGGLHKPEQRSFFPPIFNAVSTLDEILSELEPMEFELMQLHSGGDLFSRGIEIVRTQVFSLNFQYPAGVECIVANTLPLNFSEDAEVACPDFRFFLSPLRMALGLMGSKLGETPKESWWLEPCEPLFDNPMPAVFHQIYESLKSRSNDQTDENPDGKLDKSDALDSSELDTDKKSSKNKHTFCELAAKAAEAYKRDCDREKKTLPLSSWMAAFIAKNAGVTLWRKAKANTLTKKLQSHRDTWDPDEKYRR